MTDANGLYAFQGLRAGRYEVQFDAGSGYAYTAQDQGGNDAVDSDADAAGRTAAFTLNAGQKLTTIDAGVVPDCGCDGGTIGDRVFDDSDGDGIQDAGERGLAGVSLTLRGAGADGTFGTADDTTAATVSDADGRYAFGGLAAGRYRIEMDAPAGYVFSPADQGSDDTIDSDVGSGGRSGTITLADGETNLTVDVGLRERCDAQLGDRVFRDADGDGIQDSGEQGVAGVAVQALWAGNDRTFGTSDDVTLTTTTAADGSYLFTGLMSGAYRVTFAAAPGETFTLRDQGADDAADSDVDAAGRVDVTLGVSEIDLTVDAGLAARPQGAIGDRVFEDAGWIFKDYVQTAGEKGLAGITVTLRGAGADGIFKTADDTTRTTVTDANGNYLFDGLDAGLYKVKFDARWGYKLTVANWGSDDTIDSDADANGNTGVITLAQGERNMTVDAGLYDPTSSPIVLDLDGNGIHTVAMADSPGGFDLLGVGVEVQSGWIDAGDAFLAVDRNGNGSIDGIAELFGGTLGQGYAQLAAYDGNGDGVVDARDEGFGTLRVWQDADGDHRTDAGELRTLAEAGIAALNVDHVVQRVADGDTGNYLGETGSAVATDGRTIQMTDVYFEVGDVFDPGADRAAGTWTGQHDEAEAMRHAAWALQHGARAMQLAA